MTLRIKSKNGRLECLHSEDGIDFTPIHLKEQAELHIRMILDHIDKGDSNFELSPTECEVFEVKKCAITGEPMLFLKEPVKPEIQKRMEQSLKGINSFTNQSESDYEKLLERYINLQNLHASQEHEIISLKQTILDNRLPLYESRINVGEQQLITLGKEILKHQSEMLVGGAFQTPAVTVGNIIQCFDKLGVSIEEKIEF